MWRYQFQISIVKYAFLNMPVNKLYTSVGVVYEMFFDYYRSFVIFTKNRLQNEHV